MNRYTVDDVVIQAGRANSQGLGTAYMMLHAFADRIRQDAEENERDPAADPRPGDRVELVNGGCVIFNGREAKAHELREWEDWCSKHGATIVRRREIP